MHNPYQAFVEALAARPAPRDAVNPFSNNHPDNAVRRHNLALYLQRMEAYQPRAVLVGEAPSYRGMRVTGVPFGSRAVILTGVPGIDLFGAEHGYLPPDKRLPNREASATIVWGAIADCRPLPLLWNAYPFHPHKPGNPDSNRKPRREEVLLGQPFLRELIRLFALDTIVAVGNTAYDSLNEMGIESVRVRHPAQGGKADFVAGIRALFGKP